MAAVSVSGFAAVRPLPLGSRLSQASVSSAGGTTSARVPGAGEVGDKAPGDLRGLGKGKARWALQARGLFRPRRRSAPGPDPAARSPGARRAYTLGRRRRRPRHGADEAGGAGRGGRVEGEGGGSRAELLSGSGAGERG